jgi:hypothetical protein
MSADRFYREKADHDGLERLRAELRQQREYAAHDASLIADLLHIRTEAAAFLDGLAKRLDNPLAKSLPQAAADCRAMAAKLRALEGK